MIGQTISHYKIVEKLGEGGMGIVYKAEDLKLKRTVAIKFLPERLSAHGDERERFEHEAQAASGLNHPNICTIHEIDEHDGDAFIVMEYVEGTTLREWIRRSLGQQEGYRKLAVKEAIALAMQIAGGLAAAHERGIVHRDVKSENIMVTADGRAKIMDFGLAKLRGVSKLTKTGSTVGTIAYMSPEQVEGLETDHRTDVFSYGVVLYEMLAGSLPFQAAHDAAVMYEIINVHPRPLAELRQSVDAELNRIVMTCLEKDRDTRYQSIREVVADLKRYARDSEGKTIARLPRPGAESPSAPGRSPGKRSIVLIAAAAVLGAAAVIVFWRMSGGGGAESSGADRIRITKITARIGLEDEPSWSPDGKFIAYTSDDRGNYDILITPIAGSGQPIRITADSADDMEPAWSPDGSKIAFVSSRGHGGHMSMMLGAGPIEPYVKGKNGSIYLAPAFGGAAVKLVDDGFDPAWSPDGKTIVFRSIRRGDWDLWSVPADGGTPTQLTHDGPIDYHPGWSPDGKWIVYASAVGEGYQVCLIPSTGGSPVVLTHHKNTTTLKPAWSSDGKQILFSSTQGGSMNIWKAAFFPETKSIGEPIRVTVGEGDNVNISATAGSKIAFATVKSTSDIWEYTLATGSMRQISSETSSEDSPSMSPDGKTLLVQSDRTGLPEIWTMDPGGNFLAQLTSSAYGDLSPRWSPDGKRFAYAQLDSLGSGRIMIQSVNDVAGTQLTDNGFDHEWSHDGKSLTVDVSETGPPAVWVINVQTREKRPLVSMALSTTLGTWSPDGKWIAFNTEEKNSRQVWIVPSSGGTPRRLISGEAEYSHPEWSPRDLDVLCCLEDHKNLCLVSADKGTIRRITAFRESNVGLDYPTWSPDGTKIYLSLWKKTGDLYTLENY